MNDDRTPMEKNRKAFELAYAAIPAITPTKETAWLIWKAALSDAPAQEPVAEAIRELIGEIEQEFVALPDLPAWIRRLQERVRIAPPDWKGYALLGTGQYAINHTPAPMDPQLGAELIISIATEVDKAGNRQVGEERDTDPNAGPIMPEQMAVRIGFLTPAALDALESQLRHLRRENFPESASPLPQEPQEGKALTDAPLPPEIEGRLSVWLTLGKELHPLTVNLVVRFARALASKLADAEKKYGYSDGWRSPDWMDECRAHLMEHIAKGDPRDVAAYCAFLWHHGESTASPIERELRGA